MRPNPRNQIRSNQSRGDRTESEAGTAIPFDHAAGVVGHRAFATHFVEAVAFFRVFVVKSFDKQTGVVERTAVAGIVYALRIEGFGSARTVEFGYRTESNQVYQHAGHDFADGGQPGTLIMGLPLINLWIGVAPVGLGLACTHPLEAQLPQAIMALASSATSSRTLEGSFTANHADTPSASIGTEPSMQSTYSPLNLVIVSRSDFSA